MIEVFQTLIFIEKLLLHLRTAGWSRIQYYMNSLSLSSETSESTEF